MAPPANVLESQTSQIIACLFRDEDEPVGYRQASDKAEYETDGPEDFDPVIIADKLRAIGDSLDASGRVQDALGGLMKAAVQKELEAAFGQGVEALVQTQAGHTAEVAPEMQLIRASVTFGLYIKKCCPELKQKAQSAMTAYLNQHVGAWVSLQGGWDHVADL